MLSSDLRKLRRGYSQIPVCATLPVDEAIRQLRGAGVTGSIDVIVLSAERAHLYEAPGRVTNTQPISGEFLAPGEPVTVWVNPGEAGSALTEHEQRFAERARARAAERVAAREQIFIDSPRPRPNRDEVPSPRRILSIDMLEAFNDRLRGAGARMAERWRPGLTDTQIDELLLPAGIDLPEEARVWWRFYDGQQVADDGTVLTLGGRQFPSLEYAVEWYEQFRGMFYETDGVDGLLLALLEQPVLHFDCSRGRDQPVPVYAIPHAAPAHVVCGSIGDLVLAIEELFDCGALAVNADGRVVYDWEIVPDHLRFV
jgi:hypothetical protein